MVPFFGQGLNCGLEDVRVLDIILRNEGVDPAELATPPQVAGQEEDAGASASRPSTDARLERALRRYSENRHEDLLAISDLAMAN